MNKVLFLKNIEREGPGFLSDLLDKESISYDIVLAKEDLLYKEFHEKYDFLVVLGGPSSANDKTFVIQRQVEFVRNWLGSGKPYLGVCLGMQIMAKSLGGQVVQNNQPEIGFYHLGNEKDHYKVKLVSPKSNKLASVLPAKFPVFQLHGETVIVSEKLRTLATSKYCDNQIIVAGDKQIGVQFHLEVTERVLMQWFREDDDLIFIDQAVCLQGYKRQKEKLEQNCSSLLKYLLS